MKFNNAGLQLIKSFEGCALHAYQDGGGKWTIGYGCTHHVRPDMTILQEEADDRLRDDIQSTVAVVMAMISPHSLSDNQFSACVCFAYNVGTGEFKTSTLLNCIKMGHPIDAANEFEKWDHDKGVEVPGLLRRRQAEKALFLS